METTKKARSRVYELIQQKREEYNLLISNEDATYLLASNLRIDFYNDLSKEKAESLRKLINKKSSPRVVMEKTKEDKPLNIKIGQEFVVSNKILPKRLANEASEMAKIYPIIYVFENSIRYVIIRVLSKGGVDWWTTSVQNDIQKKATDRINQELKRKWHGKRGAHPIFYVDIEDLSRIISKNWSVFKTLLNDLEWVKVCINSIKISRNVIAHNNPLSRDDIKRIKVFFNDWIKQIS